MIWADLLLTDDRNAAKQFPTDVAACIWGYEAFAPFDHHAKRLREDSNNTRPIWLCPGTSAWRSITGRSSTRNANITAAVNAAINHDAQAILMTEWGDHGHRQTWPIALHAIAHAAACSWNPQHTTDPDHRATSIHCMQDTTGDLAPFIETLGDIDEPLRKKQNLFNASALYTELHEPLTTRPPIGTLADWQLLSDQLDALAQPHSQSRLINDELTHTRAVARIAIQRAIYRRDRQSTTKANLIDALNNSIADHRTLWPARSRPGGLDDPARYYEHLRDELINHQ
jgi:hypothetical protein